MKIVMPIQVTCYAWTVFKTTALMSRTKEICENLRTWKWTFIAKVIIMKVIIGPIGNGCRVNIWRFLVDFARLGWSHVYEAIATDWGTGLDIFLTAAEVSCRTVTIPKAPWCLCQYACSATKKPPYNRANGSTFPKVSLPRGPLPRRSF